MSDVTCLPCRPRIVKPIVMLQTWPALSAEVGSLMLDRIVALLVLLFAALATGALIVNWVGLGRAMSKLSASAYVEFHQLTNRTFDPYMPIVVIGATLGGAALGVQYGIHSMSGQLAAAGAVCYALVIIIGVPTCVRINHEIAHWSVRAPPRDWAQTRSRWIRYHMIRTLFSVPGFAIYAVAVMIHIGR
jgi:Domain of unknown function (DUF1772)